MDRYERILSLHRTLKTARYPVPQALLALNELVGRTGPGILASALAPLRSRIDRLLSDQTDGKSFPIERIRVIGSGTRRVDEATFRHVAGAVLGRKRLRFRYRARTTNETTQRDVSPQ